MSYDRVVKVPKTSRERLGGKMSEDKDTPKQVEEIAQDDLALTDEEAGKVGGGAADIFIKLGDIKGESTDSSHKPWTQIVPPSS
jgi:hypothetical protein